MTQISIFSKEWVKVISIASLGLGLFLLIPIASMRDRNSDDSPPNTNGNSGGSRAYDQDKSESVRYTSYSFHDFFPSPNFL